MTDPIRIPILNVGDPPGMCVMQYGVMDQPLVAAIAHAIAADPEAARGIVAAAQMPRITELDDGKPKDYMAIMPTPPQPAAGDEAAVEALRSVSITRGNSDDDGTHMHFLDLCDDEARGILAAIKAGKVPGLWAGTLDSYTMAIEETSQRQADELASLRAELAAEKGRAEKAEKGLRISEVSLAAHCQGVKEVTSLMGISDTHIGIVQAVSRLVDERDNATARVAELDKALTEANDNLFSARRTNLDYNGRVFRDGKIIDGLRARVAELEREVAALKATARQRGTACLTHDLVHGWACPGCLEDATARLAQVERNLGGAVGLLGRVWAEWDSDPDGSPTIRCMIAITEFNDRLAKPEGES